ncbi:hypothetical protein [Streptomyces sp. NBC_00996]|nr:hypothetical protein OG390_02085 [Streptomyces sp. NBC_00996]
MGMLTIADMFLYVFRRLADLLGPLARRVLQEPPGPPKVVGAPHDP